MKKEKIRVYLYTRVSTRKHPTAEKVEAIKDALKQGRGANEYVLLFI